jgi:hemolysin III
VIYAVWLIAMLGFSAAYNLWPVSPRKWWLRRFDHSAIFIFIAATYTPLIAQLNFDSTTFGLLIGVWVLAALGVALKLFLPGLAFIVLQFDIVAVEINSWQS